MASIRPLQDVKSMPKKQGSKARSHEMTAKSINGLEEDGIQDEESKGTGGPRDTVLEPLNLNVYATKKTIAQGLLDVALLTANASQLKYILQSGPAHSYFYLMVTLISLSLILQVALGGVIIVKSRYNFHISEERKRANELNNAIVWLVFGVTTINVFIAAFGIEPAMDNTRKFTTVAVGLLFIWAALLDLNESERHKLINKVNNWATLLVFLITVDNIILSGFGLSSPV